MKALVFGGTGFIGRRVVKELLCAGDNVTVATTGFNPDQFGSRVSRIVLNRFNPAEVSEKFANHKEFDVIYDMIAFGTDDVETICNVFRETAGHYVFVSSAGVYRENKLGLVERDFDASSVEPEKGGMRELGYADGKRNAEAYLSRNAPFPFSAIRFPVVLGHDDIAGREQFPLNRIDGRMLIHVQRIMEGKAIIVPGRGGKRNYTWVEDAGRFIVWAGRNRKRGAYNAASAHTMDAIGIIGLMGKLLGNDPVISSRVNGGGTSSFYYENDRSLSARRAISEGFRFTPFLQWFPSVVEESVKAVR